MDKPIVVGTDGSPPANKASQWAADEAARLGRPLIIVHVVENWIYGVPLYPVPGILESLTESGHHILRRAREQTLAHHAHLPVEARLVHDNGAAAGLAEHGKNAYELVLGHRGRGGFTGMLLGSTGLKLAGHLAGPVVIVRGEADAEAGVIVVGLDLRHDPVPALEYAFTAADARGARLHAIHAWQPTPGGTDFDREAAQTAYHDHLAAALAPWRTRYPDIKTVEDVVIEHPADALIGASAHADLVVIGRRPASGPHFGSVGHGAIHHAHCPVAVVRPAKS